jgi:ABC-type nitrate/sulfonate/bicarbonate transport system permease component
VGDGEGVKSLQTRNKLIEIAQYLSPLLIIGILWEISVRSGLANVQTLPAPSMILHELYVLVGKKAVLQYHISHSFYRLAVGYILAVVLGISFGTVLALQRELRTMFSPVLSLLISVPTIAWIPVLLITMGLGDKTVITAIFLGGVFEMMYSTIAGIRSVQRQQINAAQIMGVRGLGLFFKVLLPGSLVTIMPALRLSIGYCWRALVGGEMLSAMIKWGVGKMIYDARFWNDVKAMFVGLMVIAFFGVLLDRTLLKRLEHGTVEKWGMLVER